jgi:hypothetical protein
LSLKWIILQYSRMVTDTQPISKPQRKTATTLETRGQVQVMRDQGITLAALGGCIGVDGRQIRRILDLDHNTSLAQLVRGLKCLGKELVIDIRSAA